MIPLSGLRGVRRRVVPVLAGAGFFHALRTLQRDARPILKYHRIFPKAQTIPPDEPVPVEDFEQQMEFLHRAYQVVPVEELATASRPRGKPLAAITLDDGYREVYTHVLPILEKYRLPAAFYVCAKMIAPGDYQWIDVIKATLRVNLPAVVATARSLGLPTADGRSLLDVYMKIQLHLEPMAAEQREDILRHLRRAAPGVDDLLERDYALLQEEHLKLIASSRSQIGSHTNTHPSLPMISLEEAAREIRESKTILESVTGKPVTTFCYPRGKTNAAIRDIVEKTGYQAAVCSAEGIHQAGADRFMLKRLSIGSRPVPWFEATLSGFLLWVSRNFRFEAG